MEDLEDFQSLLSLIKKDPEGYVEEISIQLRRFDSLYDLIKIKSTLQKDSEIDLPETFPRLINFLVTVSPRIPKKSSALAEKLTELGRIGRIQNLTKEVRLGVIKSLISLHNCNIIDTLKIAPVFIELFNLSDKEARALVFHHLIKSISKKKGGGKKEKGGSLLKIFVGYLNGDSPVIARKVCGIMSELYRRNIWREAKVVNIISECCFSKYPSLLRKAARFLLGQYSTKEDADEEEELIESRKTADGIRRAKLFSKKSAKKENKLRRITKKIKKIETKEEKKEQNDRIDLRTIRSLNDPHGFGQKLFRSLRTSRENFETKLLLMNLLSRVIGCHELIIPNFYSFLQRYMQAHQQNVTKVLTFLVQATHSKVPEEVLSPSVRLLACNFVNDRSNYQTISFS